MQALRWGLLLPCSMLAGYLAYFIGGTMNRFMTMMFAGPPPSWPTWLAVATDATAHIYIGLAITYVAVRIAPAHHKPVAATVCGLCVLLAGASIFAAVLTGKFISTVSATALVFGSVALTVAVFRDGLDVGFPKVTKSDKIIGANHGQQ